MEPGIGVQRRTASAAKKDEDVVFECADFVITRESKDRYRYRDALTVTIRSAAELDKLLAQRCNDNKRLYVFYATSRRELQQSTDAHDAAPPPELVRKVQIESPVRPAPPPFVAPLAARPRTPVTTTTSRKLCAPPKRGSVLAQPADNDNATRVPHKEPTLVPDKPKRRVGGLSFLRLLAQQEAAAAAS